MNKKLKSIDKDLKNGILNLIANIIILTFITVCMINKNISSVSYVNDISITLFSIALLILALFISFLGQNKVDEDKVTVSKMMSTKGREEVFSKTFKTDRSTVLKIIDKFSCLFNFLIYLFLGIAISDYDVKNLFIVTVITTIMSSVFTFNLINEINFKNKKVYIKVMNKFTDIFIKILYSFVIANITIIS